MRFGLEKMSGKIKFEFEAVDLDSENRLLANYKCEQFDDNQPRSNGWFYNAHYDAKRKAILFPLNTTIAGKKVDGVSLDDEICQKLDNFKQSLLLAKEEEVKRIKAYCPTKIRWAIGGDTHNVSISTDEIETWLAQPDCFTDIQSILDKMDTKDLVAMSKPLSLSTGLYTQTGWYEIEVEKLPVDEQKKERLKKEQLKKEQLEEIEGAIAFNRCWECGVSRIVGKIRNGHVTRMPKIEWAKAQKKFEEAWQKQFENEKAPAELVSSAGTNWREYFEKSGYKSIVVSEDYDGC